MKDRINDVISIDEQKASLLMLLLLVSFGFGMYQVYEQGDISGNLLQLLFMLIGAVSGINIAAKFSHSSKNGQVNVDYENERKV